MRKFSLVEFSVDHPRLVVLVTIILSMVFMTQFPKIKTDTNPKNMLPATSDVRVWNDEVEKAFNLYEDTSVVMDRQGRIIYKSINSPDRKYLEGLRGR
jgi:predicted RND superfamily exporter protein